MPYAQPELPGCTAPILLLISARLCCCPCAEEDIKAATQRFDLEIVRVLNLSKKVKSMYVACAAWVSHLGHAGQVPTLLLVRCAAGPANHRWAQYTFVGQPD